MDVAPFLKQLSEAHGVSGYEHQVRQVVQERFGQWTDQVKVDALGNVIAVKQGTGAEPRRRILLAAHMDEIGLIISHLDNGFLGFQHVGGYDDRVLLGQEVVVHGRRDLAGIIGARPPHVLPAAERKSPISSDSMRIDVGLEPQRLVEMVRVGDLVTMNSDLTNLHRDRVSGKALDDRACVAAVGVCLEALSRVHHEWDVYAVATVQEELGYHGAITSAYNLRPDVAIAVDVTFARQPGVPDDQTVESGKGPAIAYGPNYHPKLSRALVETAQAMELSYQVEPSPRPGGTDAYATQVSTEGVPSALVSIPLRNMHTPVETGSVKDIERTSRLLAQFAGSLDDSFLDSLSWDLNLLTE